MEVKRAIEDVYTSKTLKRVLSTLLSIGNFLNGTQVNFEPFDGDIIVVLRAKIACLLAKPEL